MSRIERLACRRASAGRLAFLLCIAAVAFSSGCGRRRPDVLLITIDTVRADHLGCYGDGSARTPHLDRLARDGVLFENAVCPAPTTLPAHASMMTGEYPRRHGVRNNGAYRLGPDASTLAERFRDAGYRTGAFVSAYVLNREFGLDQGFEAYDDSLFGERTGAETVRRALGWLGRRDARPAFLWVHLFEPHTPWTPPLPYSTLPLASAYDQEIAAADGLAGELAARFRAHGRSRHAIIAVVADHGEGLGDHGEVEHGIFLYRETTRVPWILCVPGGPKGLRVPDLVSTVDLAPSLAELAGLRPLPSADGVSVAPVLHAGALPARPGVLIETVYPEENFGWASLAAFVTPDRKFILGPDPELYDLRNDPGERRNVIDLDTEDAALLQRRLERGLQSITPPPGANLDLVPDDVPERLRSLGYLSAGSLPPGAEKELPDPKRMIRYHDDFQEAKRAMEDRRFRDAVAPFRRVLEGQKGNLLALLGLGMALNRTLRFAEAEEVFQDAIEVAPTNTTVLCGMADALYGQEDWSEALDLYEIVERDTTRTVHACSREAICLSQLSRHAEADRRLTAAARRYPELKPRLTRFSARLASYRNSLAARGDTASLVKARSSASLGLVAQAVRFAGGQYPEPKTEVKRLRFLENFYTSQDRPKLALEALKAIIQVDGPNLDRRLRQAGLLLSAGDPAAALAVYEGLNRDDLSRTGRLAVFRYNRACALARLGRYEEAVGALSRAVRAGYRGFGPLLNNRDLLPLRARPDFQALLDSMSMVAERPERASSQRAEI